MARKKATPTRLSYVGIKQIGSFWYSSKDGYSKSFESADMCAKHFNNEVTDETDKTTK